MVFVFYIFKGNIVSCFLRESYYQDLNSSNNLSTIGKDMTKEEISYLSDEQKKTLSELKKSVEKSPIKN